MSDGEVTIRQGIIPPRPSWMHRVLPPQFNTRPETLRAMELVVAEAYGLEAGGLREPGRKMINVYPRLVAMYFMRHMTSATLHDIGRHFGKDHGTVMHAHEQIGGHIKCYPEVREALGTIEQKLRAKLDQLAKNPPVPAQPPAPAGAEPVQHGQE